MNNTGTKYLKNNMTQHCNNIRVTRTSAPGQGCNFWRPGVVSFYQNANWSEITSSFFPENLTVIIKLLKLSLSRILSNFSTISTF